jgi:dGTPase
MAMKSRRVVDELFSLFMSDPGLLPAETAEKVAVQEKSDGTPGRARGVADYIAGMTDRYAFAEHERLYLPRRLT